MERITNSAQFPAAMPAGNADPVRNLEERKEKQIEQAAGGFESILVHQLLKGMWETVGSTGFLGEESNAGQIFRDMFHQAIADSIAQGPGIGIKAMMKRELEKAESASKIKSALRDV